MATKIILLLLILYVIYLKTRKPEYRLIGWVIEHKGVNSAVWNEFALYTLFPTEEAAKKAAEIANKDLDKIIISPIFVKITSP